MRRLTSVVIGLLTVTAGAELAAQQLSDAQRSSGVSYKVSPWSGFATSAGRACLRPRYRRIARGRRSSVRHLVARLIPICRVRMLLSFTVVANLAMASSSKATA